MKERERERDRERERERERLLTATNHQKLSGTCRRRRQRSVYNGLTKI
jgi:hypothetical protein